MNEINVPPDQFGKRGLGAAFGVGTQQLRIRLSVHLPISSRRAENRTGKGTSVCEIDRSIMVDESITIGDWRGDDLVAAR
jgi:hypothetical protein